MKIENDKLKEKLQEISNELKKVQEAMKEHRDGGHIENTQDTNLPTSHVRSGEHGELIIIIITLFIKRSYPLLKALYNHTESYIINKNFQICNHILLYDT